MAAEAKPSLYQGPQPHNNLDLVVRVDDTSICCRPSALVGQNELIA